MAERNTAEREQRTVAETIAKLEERVKQMLREDMITKENNKNVFSYVETEEMPAPVHTM